MIHTDHDICPFTQVDKASDFLRSNYLVGNQNIPDPTIGHHFGLTQFGARYTVGTRVKTQPGEIRVLHGLGVRSPTDAGLANNCFAHFQNVPFKDIQVHQQYRRV